MPEKSSQPLDAYLGQGLSFPIQVGVQGGLQLNATYRNVEDSIGIILRTSLGERIYRPDFGSRLSELVFAPLNTQTLLLIKLYVEEALQKWEPRIVLDRVRTAPDPVNGRVDIIIEYYPKRGHDSRSLVYPFYLLPPGAV
ncbi:MAG: GPW/gp25 family protein [Leptolyngbyaceae cyanobacterium SM1_1_3]|nr:GPW/gp25 family protein [Leptolyngbyaceae cyanobacterium SM1_1_3]NJN03074.1 GPW/gp25 family protein [Leptolyngbyaceae cyanobacterium RM1_1_2]NJO08753.1 GPW/gp25 family protein [Leptolyngbyaceae cyanobacterium SL_1_1]